MADSLQEVYYDDDDDDVTSSQNNLSVLTLVVYASQPDTVTGSE